MHFVTDSPDINRSTLEQTCSGMLLIEPYHPPSQSHLTDTIASIPTQPEQHHSASIFSSSLWFIAWIKSLPSLPECLLFICEGQTVGIAFLGQTAVHPLLPFYQKWWLNQTGDPRDDQVWIEHNNIYCPPALHNDCVNALVTYFSRQSAVIQLYVSMTSEPTHWTTCARQNQLAISTLSIPAYKTRLQPEYRDTEALIATLSKNSRGQLRRSIKKLTTKYGEIAIHEAKTAEERADFFQQLASNHIQKWAQTEEGSGFTNPVFVAHHQSIIDQNPENVSILRVTAGPRLLGYTYNLIWQNTVYFYCSGISEDPLDKHIKPGYVTHLFAMAYYAQRGLTCYDFLGGESQYKKSLASQRYDFYQLSVYNKNWSTRLLLMLKRLKDAW